MFELGGVVRWTGVLRWIVSAEGGQGGILCEGLEKE